MPAVSVSRGRAARHPPHLVVRVMGTDAANTHRARVAAELFINRILSGDVALSKLELEPISLKYTHIHMEM